MVGSNAANRQAGSRVPLGEFPGLGLLDARERANDLLSAASAPDFDKTLTRFNASETPSLETLCLDYVAQMRSKGQMSHSEYQRVLVDSPRSFCKFMEARFGEAAKVGDVRTSHVTDWLREIYERAPSHARHCRAYLHAVFQWALKAEFDYTSSNGRTTYGISANPVSSTPGGARSRKLEAGCFRYRSCGIYGAWPPQVADPCMVAAVRMIIAMGGLRITEILHSEISWYEDGWLNLPKTKNGREHLLPLTELAKQQLLVAKSIHSGTSSFLFPHQFDVERPMLTSSASRMTKRLVEKCEFESVPASRHSPNHENSLARRLNMSKNAKSISGIITARILMSRASTIPGLNTKN